MKLKNKVAIITGGGKGIGKAIALAFASEGATVVVAGRTLSNLEETVEEIKSNGGVGKVIQTDITDEKQVQRVAAETFKEYGRIDILVNNSGIGGPHAEVVDLKMDDWNEVVAVNLTGSLLCAREVLKYMIPQRRGNIINMAAERGRAGDGRAGAPLRSAYCCTKMGIIGLTETLSVEVGKYNIRVNAISPAAVNSERRNKNLKVRAEVLGVTVEELERKTMETYSLGRPAEPSEIASCAVFLASDDSSVITGQTIVTHCGQHIVYY